MVRKRLVVWAALSGLLFVACAAQATPTPTVTRGPVETPSPTLAPTRTVPPTPTAGPKYGGILGKSLISDVRGTDPYTQSMSDLQDVIGFVHSRLFRYNPGPPECSYYPLKGDLALGWNWVDDLTIDVTLRRGVKFPPGLPYYGREFTASDVIYSVTKQWPKNGLIKSVLAIIDRVEERDPYTVRFHLKEPMGLFSEKVLGLDMGWIMGPEPFGMSGKPDDLDDIMENIGLGPFRLTNIEPGTRATLRKNADWYLPGLPYLDGIELRVMPDLPTQVAALRAGKLDYVYFRSLATPGLELERTDPQLNIGWCPFFSPTGVYMRTDKAPFNDVRVRRALSMAVDRKAMLSTVFDGKGVVIATSLPPFLTEYYLPLDQYPPEVRQYFEYNPTRARQLLGEAGYPNGFAISMVTTPIFKETDKMAEVFTDLWGAIGVRVSIKSLEYGAYVPVYSGKYDDTAAAFVMGGTDVDTAVWDQFYSAGGKLAGVGRNRSYVNDRELDRLLEATRRARDKKTLIKLYHDIQIRQVEQQYYILTALQDLPAVWQPWVKGVVPKGFTRAEQSDLLYVAWLDK